MNTETELQYIYIVQASNEKTKCKIGLTSDLDERLKSYNRQETGKSSDAVFSFLFACKVSDMRQVERDFLDEFRRLREQPRTEMLFYNTELFGDYVNFIKEHPLFIKEVFFEKVETENKVVEVIKVIKKDTPSLKERELTPEQIMKKARRISDDEFYTRFEDIEKEVSMYDKSI